MQNITFSCSEFTSYVLCINLLLFCISTYYKISFYLHPCCFNSKSNFVRNPNQQDETIEGWNPCIATSQCERRQTLWLYEQLSKLLFQTYDKSYRLIHNKTKTSKNSKHHACFNSVDSTQCRSVWKRVQERYKEKPWMKKNSTHPLTVKPTLNFLTCHPSSPLILVQKFPNFLALHLLRTNTI